MVFGIGNKIQQAMLAANHLESRINAKPSGFNKNENLFARRSDATFAFGELDQTINSLKAKKPGRGKAHGHHKHANKAKKANAVATTAKPQAAQGAQGGDKLQQAMQLAAQFLQQTGKTDLLQTLQNSKVTAGNLPEGTLGQYDGQQITISQEALQNATPEKIASIIAHEAGHANDGDVTSSMVEERDMFMLGEELLDFYGQGEFDDAGAALANKLDGLISKAYAGEGLGQTSAGHTGALMYSA